MQTLPSCVARQHTQRQMRNVRLLIGINDKVTRSSVVGSIWGVVRKSERSVIVMKALLMDEVTF